MSGRGKGTGSRPPPPTPALTRRRAERARAAAEAPISDEKDKDEKDEIIARANAEVERLTKLLRQATDEVDQLKQTVDDMTTVESELRDYIAANLPDAEEEGDGAEKGEREGEFDFEKLTGAEAARRAYEATAGSPSDKATAAGAAALALSAEQMMDSDIDVPKDLIMASAEGQWLAVQLIETIDSVSCRVTDDADDDEQIAFVVHAGNLYPHDPDLVETEWPVFLTRRQALAHESIADRLRWRDADFHCVLAFDLRRVPESLAFFNKPWTFMRAIVIIQADIGYDVDVHVIDGEDFDAADPRSWAAFMLGYRGHARPVLAPAAYRGVEGSFAILEEACSLR